MGLYRRLSSKFGGKSNGTPSNNSRTKSEVNGSSSLDPVHEDGYHDNSKDQINGDNKPPTNGSKVGQSLDKTKDVDRHHSTYAAEPVSTQPQHPQSKDDPLATRADVEKAFQEFAQLIHASIRPMPTQTGDGTYIEKDEPSGWFQDLRSLSLRDVNTAKEIMDDKRAGKPQDDRKMHMEHIMQVC
jgi:hypothetical protein